MAESSKFTVMVVGGAGAMGRYAVRSIARLGSANRLIIADRNVDYAQRLSAEVGPPCEVLELDVTDPAGLARAFRDCDVVCNTTGPFAIFGGPILRTALESGCHYLDIDDDWQSTVEAFELDDLALRRQVTAIVGIGGSPGVSNLLAMLASEDLDDVHSLHTGWTLRDAVVEEEPAYPPTAPASAAVEHWLLQCSGTIRVWEDGQYRDVPPVKRRVLDLPAPFGPQPVYSMGHPEAVTLPRTVPGLRQSRNFQSGPDWLFDHLKAVAAEYEAGRLTLQEGAHRLGHPPARPARTKDASAPAPNHLPAVWALAEGTKDAQPRLVMTYPAALLRGRMGGGTGVPLAIGLELLRRGAARGPGVLSPEAAIDPHDFFELYTTFLEEPQITSGTDAVVRLETAPSHG